MTVFTPEETLYLVNELLGQCVVPVEGHYAHYDTVLSYETAKAWCDAYLYGPVWERAK